MPEVLEMKNELSQVIDYGFDSSQLAKEVSTALGLAIHGVDDRDGYKRCDVERKKLVKIRTSIDKRRKELNSLAREHIKRVDAVAAELTEIAGRAEDHVTRLVDEIDQQVAAAEKEKADKFFNDRNAQLQHVGITLARIVVESMSDADISKMIDDKVESDRLRAAEDVRVAAAKAESERIAAEQAAATRKAAAQLKADREAFEKQQAAQQAELDAQRKLLEEAQEKINAAAFAVAEREREQREAEQTKERLRLEAEDKAKSDAFEAERIKVLAEKAAIDAAEKLDREEKERNAAAERAEALRPELERLMFFALSIEQHLIPNFESHDWSRLVSLELKSCADAIRRIADERAA